MTRRGASGRWNTGHAAAGDELNLIEDGSNYGWPVVSYGSDYNGAPIPGVENTGYHTNYTEPVHAWLPSVGIGGLTTQSVPFHPAWENDLLAISLNGNTLYRIRLDESAERTPRAIFAEKIAMNRRLRDIEQLDDGSLVIWTDSHAVIFLTALKGALGEQYIQQYVDGLSADAPELAAALDQTIEACAFCHSFSPQEQRIGPSLASVYGAPIGSTAHYEYSAALAEVSGRWTDALLADYLRDPEAVFAGTSMPDPGINDERVIAELVKVMAALARTDLSD